MLIRRESYADQPEPWPAAYWAARNPLERGDYAVTAGPKAFVTGMELPSSLSDNAKPFTRTPRLLLAYGFLCTISWILRQLGKHFARIAIHLDSRNFLG